MTDMPQSGKVDMDLVRREALEFAQIGLYRYAFDGRILAMDQTAFFFFELDDRFPQPADVEGRDLSEIVTYMQPIGSIREKVRQTRRVHREEFHFKTRRGTEKWALEDCYLVQDPRTGEDAVQVVVRDITQRHRQLDALHYRGEFQELIVKIATTFINLPVEDTDAGINEALKSIGTFAAADRSYIVILDESGEYGHNTHEWVAEGVIRQRPYWQHIPITAFASLAERLLALHVVQIPRVADEPELDAALKGVHEAADAQSKLLVPMYIGQNPIGLLGLDAVHQERAWPEDIVALLRVAAEMLSNAVERDRAQRERQQWVDFRQLVTEISTRFIGITVDEVDQEVQDALRIIGEFVDADRSYVGLLAPDGREMARGYEWCAPGIVSFKDQLAGEDVQQFAYALDLFKRGEILHVRSVDRLPPEAQNEKRLLELQGVRSVLDVPIFHDRRLAGYLGFDSVKEERDWSDESIALLRIVCEIFGNAFAREESESQRRRLEAQVQHAQKLESLGVLAGGIAHDFNNLLVGILGNAGLALMRLPAESPGRDCVNQIERAAMRAAELTNQLLAYSGRGQFVVQSISLPQLVDEMVHLLETVISKKATIERHLPPDLPAVNGDASQMRQIIMNLITNASDAMGDEGGIISIRGGVTFLDRPYLASCYLDEELPEGQYVYIEVADQGSGMDAETRARIFDPFFTTKFAGRGLGLAAVLGIIRGHHGAVKVYSEPGHGTSFKIFLPPSSREPESLVLKPEGPRERHATGTVLVVDDEEAVRDVAVAALKEEGFAAVSAENGRQGVDLFNVHNREIVAIVLDLTMPQMDGSEVLKEVRALRPDLPVVLSSGFSEQDAIRRVDEQEMGPWRFLQKPFRPAQLIAALYDALADAGLPEQAPPGPDA